MMKKIGSMVGVLSLGVSLCLGAQLAHADVEASGIEVGDQAPCVSLLDIQPDNSEVNQCIRTRPEGTKYLLLEFFSVTCGPCMEDMPVVTKLGDDLRSFAATRYVAIDRNESQVRRFLQATPKSLLHVPVSLDTQRLALKAYGVIATPTLFVLDQKNQVVFKKIGTLSDAEVETIKHIVSQ